MDYRQFFFLLLLVISGTSFAQSKAVNRDKYRIHAAITDEHINIDGVLDEKPGSADSTGTSACYQQIPDMQLPRLYAF